MRKIIRNSDGKFMSVNTFVKCFLVVIPRNCTGENAINRLNEIESISLDSIETAISIAIFSGQKEFFVPSIDSEIRLSISDDYNLHFFGSYSKRVYSGEDYILSLKEILEKRISRQQQIVSFQDGFEVETILE